LGFMIIMIEIIFWMSPNLRTVITILYALFFCFICGWGIVIPLFSLIFLKKIPSDEKLALLVGQNDIHVKDRLVDAIQVFQYRIKEKHRTSQSLAEASILKIYEEIRSLDFISLISKKLLLKKLKLFISMSLFCVLCSIFFSKEVLTSLNHLIHPQIQFLKPHLFTLSCFPGHIRVVEGEDVQIRVVSMGEHPSEMSLVILDKHDVLQRVTLIGSFNYTIQNIHKSVSYYVEADEIRTPTYDIEVVQRPLVRTIQLRISPPPYAKMGVLILQPNVGEVEALKGTDVEVTLQSNHLLKEAALVFNQDRKVPMRIQNRKSIGHFRVFHEDRYHASLVDTMGLTNSDPITYPIRIIADLHPVAHILYPGRNIDLDEKMKVDFSFEAEDDYGISQASLVYWIRDPTMSDSNLVEPVTIELPLKEGRTSKILIDWIWNLEGLNIYPEDIVYYYFEVKDNDMISGPKRGWSRTFHIRFPSIQEIVKETWEQQSEQITDLEEIYREGRDIQEKLSKLSEEVKGGREIGWEEKKQLESIYEVQNEIQKKAETLNQDLDELLNRLERYDLISMETLEKYQELQDLYQEISTPEMEEVLKKFQESMLQLEESQSEDFMNTFKFSQEAFLQSLERTISLFKRLRIEQKVDELVKRFENRTEQQELINQELESGIQDQQSSLSEEQNKLIQEMESVSQDMKDLHEDMQNMVNMPVSDLEAAMMMMDQHMLMEKLKQTAEKIGMRQMEAAHKKGCEVKKGLEATLEQMKQLQKSLKQKEKENVAIALQQASYQLLQLSQEQESLMDGINSGRLTDKLASQKQMSLISGLAQVADSLYRLSHQTFFINPEMGRQIGQAQAHMKLALQNMGGRGNQSVTENQGNAMGSLNCAVMAIQEAMNQVGGSQSGLGMEQYLLQLEKMGQQQMSLNRKMQDLFNRGQLTLADQAMMSRMAAGQKAIKQQLEELLKQYGEQEYCGSAGSTC